MRHVPSSPCGMLRTFPTAACSTAFPPPLSTLSKLKRMYQWAKLGAASRGGAIYGTLLFLLTIPFCRAVLVNRTIDSNEGDLVTGFVPIYQPQSPWNNQTCSGCHIQPDITKAFDGTWNAATYHPKLQNVNITLQFTGVAVWVFFILSNANSHGPGTTTNTQVNITLDGQYAANYSHYPDMTTYDLIYNATIFSTSGLTNTPHELVIATNDYPNSTFINFDWALYSVEMDDASASQSTSSSTTTSSSTPTSTPQSSSSKIGIIIGCTVGGLAVIALVLIFLVRRFRQASPVQNEKSEGILDIDIPPRQLSYKPQIPRYGLSAPTYIPLSASSTRSPTPNVLLERTHASRLQETRQRELNERIQSTQREIDNLKSVRNARSASEIGGLPTGGRQSRIPELASLRRELQQLKSQIGQLQAQRDSDWASSLSNGPPAYT